jgi:hypothetical protein
MDRIVGEVEASRGPFDFGPAGLRSGRTVFIDLGILSLISQDIFTLYIMYLKYISQVFLTHARTHPRTNPNRQQTEHPADQLKQTQLPCPYSTHLPEPTEGFSFPANPLQSPTLHRLTTIGVCHESSVLTQIRQAAAPRLQGRASPWQSVRDLQEQPQIQGAPTLSFRLDLLVCQRPPRAAFCSQDSGYMALSRVPLGTPKRILGGN